MKVSFLKIVCSCFIVGFYCACKPQIKQPADGKENTNETILQESGVNVSNLKTQDSDLPSINIKDNQVLNSPLTIAVNSEGKWGGFEGELGTIELFDEQDNSLGLCILSTTENWMVAGPVNYHCELSYNASVSGKGKLLIKNNNPTGEIEHDKSFVIPVRYEAN